MGPRVKPVVPVAPLSRIYYLCIIIKSKPSIQHFICLHIMSYCQLWLKCGFGYFVLNLLGHPFTVLISSSVPHNNDSFWRFRALSLTVTKRSTEMCRFYYGLVFILKSEWNQTISNSPLKKRLASLWSITFGSTRAALIVQRNQLHLKQCSF